MRDPRDSFAMGGAIAGGGRPVGFSIANMSAIGMDEDATHDHFFQDDMLDRESFFGSGNVGPDVIRLSVANSIMAKKRNELAPGMGPTPSFNAKAAANAANVGAAATAASAAAPTQNKNGEMSNSVLY